MGADHEGSEITASQQLKQRVAERFDAREKDRIDASGKSAGKTSKKSPTPPGYGKARAGKKLGI